MGLIHNEKVFALKIRESADDGSDFGTPDADYRFLFLGEDGDLHLKDSSDTVTDVGGTGTTITTDTNKLAADVTMSVTNTYVDGPSLSLAAGTYLLVGSVNIASGGAVDYTAKLWNGTTVAASGSVTNDGSTFTGCIPVSAVVTVASGTETWKISVAPNAGSVNNKIKAAALNNGAGNNASYLHSIKIA